MVGALPNVGSTDPVAYRSAAEVPSAWRAFAQQLKSHFVERLASNAKTIGKLAKKMAAPGEANGAVSHAVTVAAWVSAEGKITRLEFDRLDDPTAAELRALLMAGDVGPPPPDMLQPVRLRLALRPKPQESPKPSQAK